MCLHTSVQSVCIIYTALTMSLSGSCFYLFWKDRVEMRKDSWPPVKLIRIAEVLLELFLWKGTNRQ